MELTSFFLVGVVILLACGLWVWWKKGGSFQSSCERLRHRIRSGLQVVSHDEMVKTQERFRRLERQVEARLTTLEAATKISNQFQYFSKEIDRRIMQLETSGASGVSSETTAVHRPRSIIRRGLRFTLSDAIWANVGVKAVGDMGDSLIQSMILGPFCLVCLKWFVDRHRTQGSTEVEAKCRHCGVPWNGHDTEGVPVPLIDLKREIYDHLDREYRVRKRILPYDY